ncbi:MAG: DUF418 domain-containing protein [Acidobacteriota bacterium]
MMTESDQSLESEAGEPTPTPAAARPVTKAQRIVTLDVLRGFAVLGILVMNIQSFAMPNAAYVNPTAYGDLSGANLVVWLVSHVLADQKFMTIFSLLFGAGIALMAGRMKARGTSGWYLHLRRMGGLLVIGMIHAYGIWGGDILVTYAVCGVVVFSCRNWSPRSLVVTAVAVLCVPMLFSTLGAVSIPDWPAAAVAETDADWQPDAQLLADEIAAYRGSWWQQMEYRKELARFFQGPAFLLWTLWRAGGLMLLGMAAFKLGILSGERSRRFYRNLTAGGLGLGIPIVAVGVVLHFEHGWDWRWSYFIGSFPNYLGSLLIAAGYVGWVVGASAAGRMFLQKSLAAAGQMAFTNYLGQSILCTLLHYGHGLGWFGSVERTGQAAVVIAVWIFQLLVSNWWLARFRFGPAEWLWRSMSYGRLQPMRR